MSHQVVLPAGWPRPKGYANAVIATGRQLYIAGMIGWDADQRFHSDDFGAQARQALQNIADVLKEAGAQPQHIVRMTWYVTDVEAYVVARKEIGAAWLAVIGRHYPPMAVVEVVRLVEPDAMVEIETTAILPE